MQRRISVQRELRVQKRFHVQRLRVQTSDTAKVLCIEDTSI